MGFTQHEIKKHTCTSKSRKWKSIMFRDVKLLSVGE